MEKGILYLMPSVLSTGDVREVIPQLVIEQVVKLNYFIVENERTVRRFLKKLDKTINIDAITFYLLNKHTKYEELADFIKPLLSGCSMAVVSEAGCPGIADPGASVVEMAHKNNIKVVPWVGPSSILLALMASGLNGQNFAFRGYLTIDKHKRVNELKELEKKSQVEKQTQIFIETPYRNNQLFDTLIQTCSNETFLCIACDITAKNEQIFTKKIKDWKKKKPDLNKRPAIFLIQKK